jgi:hypothetical protein
MMHRGCLFEIGSDGYGYIVDETESGQSYPIHIASIEGLPTPVTGLEGRKVTFSIENQRVAKAMLESSLATSA